MASSCGRRPTASSSTRSGSQRKLLAEASTPGTDNDAGWSLRQRVCVAFSFLMALWVGAYGISALFIEALIRVSA